MEEEIEKKQGLPLAQKLEMFSNRLTKVFKHRSKIARRTGVGCYRIYEHDLPEFPFCMVKVSCLGRLGYFVFQQALQVSG